MATTTKVLITGANRGIGRGFVEAYLLRPNTTVIAGVRDPTHPTAQSLTTLPTALGSTLITLPLSSTDDTSASTLTTQLSTHHSINTLDIVIANAGICTIYGPATATPLDGVREHYEVNVVGVLALFQAVFPLLSGKGAGGMGKFVAISTAVASLGDMERVGMLATAYGASKAALNYVVRRIHFENEGLIAFPLNPGWVQTDMGNRGAVASGMKEAPLTMGPSISGMLDKIDNATRENSSGKFLSYDGESYAW